MNNKRTITIITIFTIMISLVGGTFAYWMWVTDVNQQTAVTFTVDKQFSCSADGGGHITPASISLEPTTCSNSSSAIKRKIVVTPDIKKNGIEISMDLWLNIHTIGSGLSDSLNFRYVLTTSEESCDKGTIISSGNFNSKKDGDKLVIMEKNYTADATETYYLYLWLDKVESNPNTMNQTFDLSLGGVCSNYLGEPEAPVLDPGMIPVTIAEDGTVTVVSSSDPNWYNYDEKQWANIVLVEENGAGETDSHPRSYYQNPANVGEEVTQEDILAYYVWVPRYKYRMPLTKCSEIENPTIEEYPGCYAPYKFETDKQKEMYESWFLLDWSSENDSDAYKEFLSRKLEKYYETNFTYPDYNLYNHVDLYNRLIATNQETGKIDPEKKVTLISSRFNGDNVISPSMYKLYDSNFFKESKFDIVFEAADEPMKLGNAISEYRSHPAFYWDHDNDGVVDSSETLPGIWVGKFYSNPEKNSDCDKTDIYSSQAVSVCNNSTQNPTILPNKKSLPHQNVSNMFYTSRNISKEDNIYGLNNKTINAHMMKNRDWAAVVYLAQSKYGINVDMSNLSTEENEYGKSSTYLLNTTGNISGIFDFFTLWKYVNVMATASTEKTCTIDDYTGDCSGFEEMPQSKYYDSYVGGDFQFSNEGHELSAYDMCTLDTCEGHALIEYTSDGPPFANDNSPWITRTILEDVTLYYSKDIGVGYANSNWRSVLISGFSHE